MIGSRSLTVTALSIGDSCVISSPTKFQLSPAPGCAVWQTQRESPTPKFAQGSDDRY